MLLIAFPVSDITVARYLSARGVPYLGIDLDKLDQLAADRLIAQLREWTSGPLLVGVSGDYEKCEVFRSLGTLDQILYWDKSSDCLWTSFVLPAGDSKTLKIRMAGMRLGAKENRSPVVAELMEGERLAGFIFRPGTESETGIYDYDAMDDFLDSVGVDG
jgi:hypothetical protein